MSWHSQGDLFADCSLIVEKSFVARNDSRAMLAGVSALGVCTPERSEVKGRGAT
jgi:hypothetical protein